MGIKDGHAFSGLKDTDLQRQSECLVRVAEDGTETGKVFGFELQAEVFKVYVVRYHNVTLHTQKYTVIHKYTYVHAMHV